MKIESLDHLVLTVASLQATRAFYEGALGMRFEMFEAADGGRRAALHFGAQKINLHEAGREFSPRAREARPGSADFCLLVSGALEDWAERLAAAGISLELGPTPRSGATGPLLSIYCRDPDGNLVELSVPAGAASAGRL